MRQEMYGKLFRFIKLSTVADYKEKVNYQGRLQKVGYQDRVKKKKQQQQQQTPSTNLYQTAPKKKRLPKSAAGDIVHKQWNMINKRLRHCRERYPTRPAEADFHRKAIGGKESIPPN
jgi:hypothetical protein